MGIRFEPWPIDHLNRAEERQRTKITRRMFESPPPPLVCLQVLVLVHWVVPYRQRTGFYYLLLRISSCITCSRCRQRSTLRSRAKSLLWYKEMFNGTYEGVTVYKCSLCPRFIK